MSSSQNVEALFVGLLEHAAASVGSIRGLRIAAFRHLPHYSTIYVTVAKFLTENGKQARAKAQAGWYFLDSLMKDAPFLYVPLVARNLLQLIDDALPEDEAWPVQMVRSWGPLLPPNIGREVVAKVVKRSAKATLEMTTAKRPEVATVASSREIVELDATWNRLGAAMMRRVKNTGISVKLERVKPEIKAERGGTVAPFLTAAFPGLQHQGGNKANEIDADAEYEPDYVAGATMQALPALQAVDLTTELQTVVPGVTVVRREKRVRPKT